MLCHFWANFMPKGLQICNFFELGFWPLSLLSKKTARLVLWDIPKHALFLLRCSNTSDGKTFAKLAWCAMPGARWSRVFKERLVFLFSRYASSPSSPLFFLFCSGSSWPSAMEQLWGQAYKCQLYQLLADTEVSFSLVSKKSLFTDETKFWLCSVSTNFQLIL